MVQVAVQHVVTSSPGLTTKTTKQAQLAQLLRAHKVTKDDVQREHIIADMAIQRCLANDDEDEIDDLNSDLATAEILLEALDTIDKPPLSRGDLAYYEKWVARLGHKMATAAQAPQRGKRPMGRSRPIGA